MSSSDQQVFDQILEYSRYVRTEPECVDYVLSQHRRLQNMDSTVKRYFVLVMPEGDQGRQRMIELVWTLAPNFEDLVRTFIRSGCIPLGMVDFASSWCEAFIDIAPGEYREALTIFAALVFAEVLKGYRQIMAEIDLPHQRL